MFCMTCMCTVHVTRIDMHLFITKTARKATYAKLITYNARIHNVRTRHEYVHKLNLYVFVFVERIT